MKEIANFFNVTTRRVIETLKKSELARSFSDLTENDKKAIKALTKKAELCSMKSLSEDWSVKDEAFILVDNKTGERIALALADGKIKTRSLSPWLSHTILERLIAAGCDLETIKEITYGDVKLLEENYRIASTNVKARKDMVDS